MAPVLLQAHAGAFNRVGIVIDIQHVHVAQKASRRRARIAELERELAAALVDARRYQLMRIFMSAANQKLVEEFDAIETKS